MTVWESVRSLARPEALAHAVGKADAPDTPRIGPARHEQERRLWEETSRRASAIRIGWGGHDDPHEQARCCECLGWTDLAERWRRLA